MDLEKIIDTSIRALPLPKLAEEGLILAKNSFKEKDNRNKVMDFLENIILNRKDFLKEVWNVKDIVKTKGLKEGVEKVVDIAIDKAKEKDIIPKDITKLIKNGKNFIIEKIFKEENLFKGQEKKMNIINENYNKWEKCIKENDFNKAEGIAKIIKKDCQKILPTIELIKKIENIDNTLMLYKNKGEVNGFTDLEKEILNKIA